MALMILNGSVRSQMVPYGSTWYCMVAAWFQMLLHGPV